MVDKVRILGRLCVLVETALQDNALEFDAVEAAVSDSGDEALQEAKRVGALVEIRTFQRAIDLARGVEGSLVKGDG